jgi:putative acetyltransferase
MLSRACTEKEMIVDLAIRAETANDIEAIRSVNREAFGGEDEARLVDALRAGGHVRLSLVAELDGQVVGHVLFSELAIDSESRSVPALALAPMAVLPAHQNQGIGSSLIRAGLEMCRERGHHIVIVRGHKDYYARFGFSAKLALSLESVYAGESFMALELTPEALKGVTGRVIYAPPFVGL